MSAFVIVYLTFSLTATLALLSEPYLRITSIGWFIGIWCLPYVGALFFFLAIVRHHKTKHTLHWHYNEINKESDPIIAGKNSTTKHVKKINDLGKSYGFLPYFFTDLDKAEILIDQQFIESLCKSIDRAQKRIWIATYILSGDVKKTVIEKLTAAHHRGVEVRLLVDRIGSFLVNPFSKSKKTFDHLPFATEVFHKKLRYSLIFIDKRLHSKIAIIDDAGFIGAHNLRDAILPDNKAFVSNVSLYFTGTVITQLEAVFADLWQMNCGEQIMFSKGSETATTVANTTTNEQDSKQAFARINFSEPMVGSFNYNHYFTALFFRARERILIWMPYFVPTQSMCSALISASKLGLEVKVLIPIKTNFFLVDNSHQLILRELTDNGVECAVSSAPFDHSKITIIDDLAIIGSTNLDHRSLFRNYECNIEVYDRAFCHSLTSLFERRYRNAEVIKTVHISKIRNIYNQLTSMIAGLY